MNSRSVIETLSLTAKLMELHGSGEFRAKAFAAAAYRLGKLRFNFEGKTAQQIETEGGLGKGVVTKVMEIISTGTTKEIAELSESTPPGIIEMLGIKGLGPKKVGQLWRDLQIESPGELLYACNENRLLALKGFGQKTQEQVKQSLEFSIGNSSAFLFAAAEHLIEPLLEEMKNQGLRVAAVGKYARKCEILDKVELLFAKTAPAAVIKVLEQSPFPVECLTCTDDEFVAKTVELSASEEHLVEIKFGKLPGQTFKDEQSVYRSLGLPLIPAELREGSGKAAAAKSGKLETLITYEDLKGAIHNHTTYSDGMHTLSEMADRCMEMGLSYFGVCDHSVSAFYANGLTAETVLKQQEEIDRLNKGYKDFRILKGIESDILSDGSLDYPEEILKTFDFVVASVHSNLKMSEEKAMTRLIKAIENPYTSILGHPSGRLLLSRPGYPLNYPKLIEACAANGVCIELNANPNRLDIDWRWIEYCMERGVLISINPDAHLREGLLDMRYGVAAARKGMLQKDFCLNAFPVGELLRKLRQKV